MIFRHFISVITLSLIAFTSTAQREVTLKIIQTSDVHGVLFPFDYTNNSAIDHGLAHVYTYVKNQRQVPNQQVILLDNGDILQGQPPVYFANYVDTTGPHLVSQVMNYMGYDAATVGNHDIEAGSKIYNKLVKDFQFPWLSANTIDTRTGKPYFKPYTTITRDGVKIAILGLTTPGIPKWLSPNLWEHMAFADMIETAKMWMDSIQINESPHIVIGLFHSGHDARYEGADPAQLMNENASQLVAKNVPGFDVVLIGHDHDAMTRRVQNINGDMVLISDPGSQAYLVSDITIKIELDKNNRVQNKTINGKLQPMQGLMPDAEFVSTFSNFTRQVEEFVDRKIGCITQPISSRDAYFGPSSFVHLIHSAQIGISNSDISIAAPLSFDTKIEQGNIYVRDLFKLYSYENLLYILNLSGKEVKDYLEYSYGLWYNTMKTANDNLLLLRQDEANKVVLNRRGKAHLKSSYYNFDSAEGINYTVDVSKPVGSRITITSMQDGSPFDLNKIYKVAVNSYRGTGGGGHLTEGVGLTKKELTQRIVNISPLDMRHYLMKWIERINIIVPEHPDNWKVIPEDWAGQAAKRDASLLFRTDEN
ncbi:MAG: bifunctional UDP-sugar hydrolase/5'-nucleotidase [Tenuifilaceae bacterium]|nr:bifunctional UDP-sugar hydrolase/5'-nucleotidase [Tenuifilaceae bacterium]